MGGGATGMLTRNHTSNGCLSNLASAETMPNPLDLLLQTPQSTKSINGPHKADGTGKFPAKYFTDSSLPGHTIYAPIKHTGEELPVLVWGNGACFSMGLMFQRFLTEIASHGFIVLANGGPSGGGLLDMFSSPSQLTQSIDWIYGGKDGGKYGKINKEKLAVAGQSCGGLESLSAAYHDDRVKYIGIFNSGLLNPGKSDIVTFERNLLNVSSSDLPPQGIQGSNSLFLGWSKGHCFQKCTHGSNVAGVNSNNLL